MEKRIEHYFSWAHSANGFVNILESNVSRLDKLYVLTENIDYSLIKKIGIELEPKFENLEYIHCPIFKDCPDGLIIPDLKLGIIEASPQHFIDPLILGIPFKIIPVAKKTNAASESKVSRLEHQASLCLSSTYGKFSKALSFHDRWEEIYISSISFDIVNELTEELINKILQSTYLNKKSNIKHRFFGGATAVGNIDFIENLTGKTKKRYFIKGRPGTGKSTMLKKIAAALIKKGYNVEIYHCGFHTESLDMLIIKELSISIFDSTSPHEYFPSLETDEIIDIYSLAVKKGTDEKYQEELGQITSSYRELIDSGINSLNCSKTYFDEIRTINTPFIIENSYKDICNEILN